MGGGTSTFTPLVIGSCSANNTGGCQQSVTVTKPSSDQIIYTFATNNGAWQSQAQYYTGSASSGTLLKSVQTGWDFTNSCPAGDTSCVGAQEIRRLNITEILPVPGGGSVSRTVAYAYDNTQYGNVTQMQAWKYYSGTKPTTPDRTTLITYLTDSNYINLNILNRPLSVTTKDGAQTTTLAQTNYTYDSTSLTPAPGITHHNDSATTYRGNPTSIQRLVGGTTFLTTTLTYDTTGQVVSVQDSNSNTTTLSYADAFYTDNGQNPPQSFTAPAPTNAYVTQITQANGQAQHFGYYYNTGKHAFSRDANGADSYSHFLDSLDRLTNSYGPVTNVSRPWSLVQYASTDTQVDAFTGIGDTSPSGSCSSCRHDRSSLDSLGRLTTASLVNDPDGATSSVTNYDTSGRVLSASNPYRSTSDPTYGFETPFYDGLNRATRISHADNNVVVIFFGAAVSGGGGQATQLCAQTTYGLGFPILVWDEAGNRQETWTDGFGRTIEVDEAAPDGSPTKNTCYAYDLLGNLTQVMHVNQTTRTYLYDSLSRVTKATTPESGATNFYYTTSGGALCSGAANSVCRRTDARGITTTFAYDTVNRLTSKTFSDTTPAVAYNYDQSSANGLTITNGLGRLTSMQDGSGICAYSYDAAGRMVAERSTIAGITKTISYAFNLDGSLKSVTYPSGRTVNYTVGNAERVLQATDAGTGAQYAMTASYAPMGALSTVIYGKVTGGFGGITEARAYNNRLEYSTIQASSSAGTALNLSYNFNTFGFDSTNNGNVVSITNNADNGRTQNFTYDPLNRIGSAMSQAVSGANCWGQGFTIDTVANLTGISSQQCSSGTLSVTVNGNNQITTTGFSYDGSGNMTADGSGYTYTFDAENRITSATGMGGGPWNYVYDGNGLRVKKSNGAGGTLYWRSLSGDVIAETDLNGSTTNEYVFFAGRRISRVDASGNVFFYYADHLGTTRTITNGTGNTCYDADFTPYGQEMVHTSTCPQNYKFTGYERDAETGLDYAMFRYYNPRLGRFMSSDPLGGDLGDPQSQDGYSYVRNSTTAFVDPLGLSRNPAYFANTNPGAMIDSFTYWGIPVWDMTGFGFTDVDHGSVWGELLEGVGAGRALPGIVTPPDIREALPPDWQTGPFAVKPVNIACPVNAQTINSFLQNTPLAGQGAAFADAGSRYNVDPRFIVAISSAETSYGRNITSGQYNAWNWFYNGPGNSAPFSSWAAGINSVTRGIGQGQYYFQNGLTTTSSIATTYCQRNCSNWLGNVNDSLALQGGTPNSLGFPCKKAGQ